MNYVNPTISELASNTAPFSHFWLRTLPRNWDATNYESHRSSKFVIESSLACRSPSSTASYLASLLEAAKANLIAWAMDTPSEVCRTISASPHTALDEPSVFRIQNVSPRSRGCTSDISTIKSART